MPLAVRSCHYQASGRRRRRSSGHNRVAGSERGSCWWLVTPAASQTRAPSEAMTAIAAGHLLTCPAGQNAIADAVIRATQGTPVCGVADDPERFAGPQSRAPGTGYVSSRSNLGSVLHNPAGSEMPKPNTAPSRRGAARTSACRLVRRSPPMR
jgi:hypothetical protein